LSTHSEYRNALEIYMQRRSLVPLTLEIATVQRMEGDDDDNNDVSKI